MAPCTKAEQDVKAPVSKRCCTVMEKKLKNPSCLCAIIFSRTANNAGVKPEVAVTIPKRCNIAVRPVGHQYGGRIRILFCVFFVSFSHLLLYNASSVSFILMKVLFISCSFSTDLGVKTPMVRLPVLNYLPLAISVFQVLSLLLVNLVINKTAVISLK